MYFLPKEQICTSFFVRRTRIMPPPPWRLLNPTRVLYYVKDEDALRLLANTDGPPLTELRLIVGLSVQKSRAADGSTKEVVVLRGERSKWQLFDKTEYLVRIDDPKIVVCVGPDVKFFVDSIAHHRDGMAFFKHERLKRFITGTLFASDKKVVEYAGMSYYATLLARHYLSTN